MIIGDGLKILIVEICKKGFFFIFFCIVVVVVSARLSFFGVFFISFFCLNPLTHLPVCLQGAKLYKSLALKRYKKNKDNLLNICFPKDINQTHNRPVNITRHPAGSSKILNRLLFAQLKQNWTLPPPPRPSPPHNWKQTPKNPCVWEKSTQDKRTISGFENKQILAYFLFVYF